MKHILSVYSVLVSVLLLALTSCSSDKADAVPLGTADEARVVFLFTLDTSGGTSMRRAAKTNAEVFDEFYAKLQNGEFVAPTYELTLTEQGSGAVQTVSGRWGSDNYVTLRTGTYRVTGRSTAEGENVQERCSFTFDETITVAAGSTAITLHADYDSFLLIFTGDDLSSLQNYNGEAARPFFTFGNYRYAFVNNSLYTELGKDAAYIEGEYGSGTLFRIMTGKLAFECGKYYVYNTATGGFDIPPMEEGDETDGSPSDDPADDPTDDPDAETLNVEMVNVPAGTFLMGSSSDDSDAQADEQPQHEVSLSAFRIGRYEVTQALWKEVMGTNPAYFQGTKVASANLQRPVENVSIADIDAFLQKLNQQTGRHFRLPTEEEWEYAARGGQTTSLRYAGSDQVADVAWYSGNASNLTHPVDDDTKQPNALGIYGMSGNVWEWTSSARTDNYEASATTNTTYRAVRGGSYKSGANSCRVAYRNFFQPSERRNDLGLRLAEDVE